VHRESRRRATASRRAHELAVCCTSEAPLALSVEHWALVVGDVTRPVDCHRRRPERVPARKRRASSQPEMVFTGKLFAYGWRMWAILSLPKLLPPVQHGGKILRLAAIGDDRGTARVALRKVQRAERVSWTDARPTLVRPDVPQSESEQPR
jgi:hypothetical protein